jgi:hypothetical protein
MPGLDPSAHVLHLLYRALHAATRDSDARLPALDPIAVSSLRDAYDTLPDPTDNDGVVPTLSQIHGDLVHATRGDHLDVIGHFGDRTVVPPHFDWLVTGSGFDSRRFKALWDDVARFVATEEEGARISAVSAASSLRFDVTWAAILLAAATAIVFYLVIVAIERLVIPWHASMRGHEP